VVHVGFAEPYCPDLRHDLIEAAERVGATVHRGGTYICIEGPQFSTMAESLLYRSWGMSVIGMTALPEARLAREAEMCYATLAMATDYDTWHPDHDTVTVELVVQNLALNVQRARDTVAHLIPMIGEDRTCSCGDALQNSIMSAPEFVPDEVKAQLRPLIGRYMK
jgi:5'-methylthioadenosine phosphorylase